MLRSAGNLNHLQRVSPQSNGWRTRNERSRDRGRRGGHGRGASVEPKRDYGATRDHAPSRHPQGAKEPGWQEETEPTRPENRCGNHDRTTKRRTDTHEGKEREKEDKMMSIQKKINERENEGERTSHKNVENQM